MNNHIKNLLFAIGFVAPLALVSCDKDIDSNPTFHDAESGSLVLNVPANTENNTYDLVNADYVVLTTTQPDYGENVPYATTYAVQVSLNNTFENEVDEDGNVTALNFMELMSTYTTAVLNVDASEINDAVLSLYQDAHDGESPTEVLPLYVRLRAYVRGGTSSQTHYGEIFSNVITLKSVLATYQESVALPEELYIVGSCVGTSWTTWKPLAPVYGMEGEFYTMIYCEANDMFKWGTYENDWRGYSAFAEINDNAQAGVSDTDGDNHNIGIANPGWYVIYITSKVVGKDIQYTLNIEKGKAYIIGQLEGGSWTDSDANNEMVAPSSRTDMWVSPAFGASGELRAYIKVADIAWWRTEFTVQSSGNLLFRTENIIDSWAEVTSDYATGEAGQKLYVNFDDNTGEIK